MDSFCFPTAPCPAKKPFLEPSVPDASLLLSGPQPNSYQAWRSHFKDVENKKVTTSILKKQVRFDSPTAPLQQIQMSSNTEDYKKQNQQITSTQYNTPPLNKVLKNKPFQEIYMANIPNRHLDLSLIDMTRPVNGMNVAVKNNDIEEERESLTPPKKTPTTYREFLEMQKSKPEETNKKLEDNNCITDIFNYTSPRIDPWKRKERTNKSERVETIDDLGDLYNRKKLSNLYSKSGKNVSEKENMCYNFRELATSPHLTPVEKKDNQSVGKTCDSSVQTSLVSSSKTDDENKQVQTAAQSDEPTVKDLLKIIQQQNEQLLLLQKQVATLLDFKENQKCIEPNNRGNNENHQFLQPTKEPRDFLNSAGSTPRKGPLPKFSIDLMTSFEVSFRPQQNPYQRKQRDFINQEPKIQEIVEGDDITNNVESRKGLADPSLYLQNPITVPENCPSPEPSINIDMKDYESSDDDDDSGSFIGASFYRKMMDQVNKIIQNAQRQATIDGRMSTGDDLTERTLSKVRDATIKQLKKINMNFSPIEEVSNCSEMSDDSDQINLAVKQLLMKYLPDDQLAKLNREDNRATNKKRNVDKIVLNSRAPQFSFATVQFMKKYDLIANNGNDAPGRRNVQERSKPTRMFKGQANNPKILDISSLKQQPKLL